MRGGVFRHDKFESYRHIVWFLFCLRIVDAKELYNSQYDPNPLDSSQKLFVDPFDD